MLFFYIQFPNHAFSGIFMINLWNRILPSIKDYKQCMQGVEKSAGPDTAAKLSSSLLV